MKPTLLCQPLHLRADDNHYTLSEGPEVGGSLAGIRREATFNVIDSLKDIRQDKTIMFE